MQVDPIKPTLKAPGTKRLKVKCERQLSSFAFNFSFRRYSQERIRGTENALDIVHKAGGFVKKHARPRVCNNRVRVSV